MKILIFFFILFVTSSCYDTNVCTDGIISLTKKEQKKLHEYIKANIKPVDESYLKENSINIDGKVIQAGYFLDDKIYPVDEVRKAHEKLFPEKVKEAEEAFRCKSYKWYEKYKQ